MRNSFPKNFLWGAATSSHQIEGDLENDWTVWEEKLADWSASKGERPSREELCSQASERDTYISGSKYSPCSYKYWKKDIEVMKELNFNAYRLSVDWSRIEPEKGVFSEEGIEYYKSVVKELKKNNIKVILSCWHWTLPLWLEREGGLLSKGLCDYFGKYTEFLYINLHDYVDYWLTINEPESFIYSYLLGTWPPGERNIFKFNDLLVRVFPNMHFVGYDVIKKYDKNIPVSVSKSFWYITPYNGFFINKIIAKISNYFINYYFLDRVKNKLDFLGLNFTSIRK